MKTFYAAREPFMRNLHRRFSVLVLARIRRALVKRHNNICSDGPLNVHDSLWIEKMTRTVNVRFERNTFRINLPVFRKGINLISSAIGEYGALPAIETMQPSGLLQHLKARAEVEVIGIAQDDPGINVLFKFTLMHGLY
jgi:hypothetical protein